MRGRQREQEANGRRGYARRRRHRTGAARAKVVSLREKQQSTALRKFLGMGGLSK